MENFNKKLKQVREFAERVNDRMMIDYIEALEDSYCINQYDKEKLNQYLDETIPILDNLIDKYKKSKRN